MLVSTSWQAFSRFFRRIWRAFGDCRIRAPLACPAAGDRNDLHDPGGVEHPQQSSIPASGAETVDAKACFHKGSR
jgi:hypothetical protein